MLTAGIRRYRAAYSGLPREAWLLAAALFVNRSGAMVMTFMALYLTSQLGLSEAAAGRMISLYGLGAICGAYAGGRLSERVGGVRLQTWCLLLSVPGYLAMPACRTWPPLAAAMFYVSFVSEAVRPANAVAIAHLTTAENRTRALALNRLAANLGFSFGPAIGGFLAKIDFTWLFMVDALTTLLAGLLLMYFFGWRTSEPAERPIEPVEGTTVSPLGDRVFVLFLLLMLANLIVFCQFGSTYPLYLRDRFRFDEFQIGRMFAVNTLMIVAVEMLLVDSIKHWQPLRTIGCGCLLSCVGFGMLPLGGSAPFAVLAMVVVTVGEMLSFPLSAGFVADRSPRGREGAYMGWYTMTFATATVLGPSIGTAIYQVNRAAVWLCGLGVGAAVFIGFQLLARRGAETAALDADQSAGIDPYEAVNPTAPLPEMAAVSAS